MVFYSTYLNVMFIIIESALSDTLIIAVLVFQVVCMCMCMVVQEDYILLSIRSLFLRTVIAILRDNNE